MQEKNTLTKRQKYMQNYNRQRRLEHRRYMVEYQRKWRQKHPEYRIREHKYRQELKQKVYEKLGGKCVCCGFLDIRALQIDHVNGGGVKEHKLFGSSFKFLRKVLADTERNYQLLCANCNWIKKFENNETRK